MSRARDGSKGHSMALPNVPKMTDDKSRIKYLTDYEKYEPELLKHHLGNADTTFTVGLKDVPAAFNRDIPLMNEPTSAEIEYEKILEMRRKRKNRNRFLPHFKSDAPQQPKKRATAVFMDEDRQPAAATTPPPTDPNAVAEAAGEGEAAVPVGGARHSISTNRSLLSPDQPNSARPPRHSNAKATAAAAAEANNASITSSTHGATGRTSVPPIMERGSSVAAPNVAGPHPPPRPSIAPSAATGRSTSKVVISTATTPSPRTAAPPTSAATSVTTAAPASSVVSARSTKSGSPQSLRFRTPSTKQAGSPTRQASSSSPRKSAATSRPSSPSERHTTLKAADVELALQSIPPTGEPTTADAAPLRLGGAAPSLDGKAEASECAELLRVLITPPSAYSESFHLDTSNINLDWLVGSRAMPARLVNLQNWQSLDNAEPRLNSPRSALVLLRNGLGTKDLKMRRSRDDDELLPQEPAMREAVKKFRQERDAERRKKLNAALVSDYLSLCANVQLLDVVNAFRNPSEHKPTQSTEIPTVLAQKKEQQKKIFATNEIRMARQLELAREVHERREAAEARRQQAMAEAKEAAEAKLQEEIAARARHQELMAEQHRQNREREAAYRHQLAERMAKADQKSLERRAAQEALHRSRQEQRAVLAAERRRRFQQNSEALAHQASTLEAEREAREIKLQEIREERELRNIEAQKELTAKLERAAVARKEARRRAEEAEERVREQARERQRLVEKRLEDFQQQREEGHQQRAQVEVQKKHRREEAYAQAVDKHESFREKTKKIQAEHDENLREVQLQRNLDALLRRERDRELAEEKIFNVSRKQRVDEFRKLRMVVDLIEKRKAADFVDEQREALLHETLKAREKLMEEREHLKQQITQGPPMPKRV